MYIKGKEPCTVYHTLSMELTLKTIEIEASDWVSVMVLSGANTERYPTKYTRSVQVQISPY